MPLKTDAPITSKRQLGRVMSIFRARSNVGSVMVSASLSAHRTSGSAARGKSCEDAIGGRKAADDGRKAAATNKVKIEEFIFVKPRGVPDKLLL